MRNTIIIVEVRKCDFCKKPVKNGQQIATMWNPEKREEKTGHSKCYFKKIQKQPKK